MKGDVRNFRIISFWFSSLPYLLGACCLFSIRKSGVIAGAVVEMIVLIIFAAIRINKKK